MAEKISGLAMPMKKVPAAPPAAIEEIEESGLGGALRTQGVGLGVAEEAGEEAFDEEEEDGEADGEADVGLRDGVAEAGQHDDEQTDDDAATVEAGNSKARMKVRR